MKVKYMPTAEKYLLSIHVRDAQKIVLKIETYAGKENFLSSAKKIQGHDAYRFRIGRYRAIFEYDTEVIYILLIDKRKDVYRSL